MSNCSLISLMTLITPSLTHCDSYSYLFPLAQFKLLTHSLTFPLAQLLAHSLTDLYTCWIVWSFIVHPIIHLLNCLLISHWFIHLLICWIVLSFANPLFELLVHSLTDSSTYSFAELFTHLLIHPLAHSLTPHCDVPPILQSKDEHGPCQNLCLRNYGRMLKDKDCKAYLVPAELMLAKIKPVNLTTFVSPLLF